MPRSRAYRERSFDSSKPVYVRKPFTANGHPMGVGQRFAWHQMAVSQRRVRQLFDMGKLRHDDGDMQSEEWSRQTGTHRTVHTEHGPVHVQTPDELDDITDMRELRAIAEREGARTTTSKTVQRKLIRENRQQASEDTAPSSEQPSAEE